MFVKCERKLYIVPTNLRVHIYSSNYIHSWKPQELKLIKTIMGTQGCIQTFLQGTKF